MVWCCPEVRRIALSGGRVMASSRGGAVIMASSGGKGNFFGCVFIDH